MTAVTTPAAVAAEADSAYAMAYFTESPDRLANADDVHFAVSDDALEWTPLNNNTAVIDPQLGTGGIRDPFLYRLQNGSWVLLATDICRTCAFDPANQNIHVWMSTDMVTWSAERMLRVNNNTSFTWAPSVYWDPGRGQYGVLFSTNQTVNGSTRLMSMVSYTSDFVTTTAPQVFYDGGTGEIDTHLVTNVGGWNYLYIRDGAGKLTGTRSRSLEPGSFVKYTDGVSVTCTEAPTLVKSLTSSTWYLWGDNFCPNGRFYAWQGDIAQGNWTLLNDNAYTAPVLGKHNTIATITATERNNLMTRWGGTNWNRLKSWNFPGRYIRHAGSQGRIDEMPFDPYQDSQWRLRPGLADAAGVSFESVNNPGQFLRHAAFNIVLAPNDNSALFRADATFYRTAGLANANWTSFRSYNFPDRYLRHSGYQLRIDPITDGLGRDDATFHVGY
ncbi:MAG TPA: glycoside hydrolase family 43 protein [Kineosporiaceae bacterium]|nr:glycoside hydrolase family 43 protein [Kineosporiaceae bacterium]